MRMLSNAPWPPDQEEIERHDRETDPKRDEQGLPYPSK